MRKQVLLHKRTLPLSKLLRNSDKSRAPKLDTLVQAKVDLIISVGDYVD